MKTFVLLILVLPFLFLASSCKYANDKSLSKIVKQEIDRYPEQRLVDIYKTFFQGFFGPAHLISDANAARNYIRQELAEADDFEDYDYCPLPPSGKFTRANLKLIKDGKVSIEDLTDALVRSAKPVSKKDIQQWKRIWPRILAEIKKQKPDMSQFQQDKEYINALLAKNEYVVHHSEEFIAKYHPHYRVVSKK
ncbi:MAG: hypothetical protein LLF92_00165 [Planctomycetaceae bacterium]|nr:hypothetical protein [Planctomycetaceae bacterium]